LSKFAFRHGSPVKPDIPHLQPLDVPQHITIINLLESAVLEYYIGYWRITRALQIKSIFAFSAFPAVNNNVAQDRSEGAILSLLIVEVHSSCSIPMGTAGPTIGYTNWLVMTVESFGFWPDEED